MKQLNNDTPIETVRIKRIYRSPWVVLEEHDVIEYGKPGMYNVVRYGDGVTILALEQDQIVLIREFKYAIGKYIYQLPSGSIDAHEAPEDAARRELLEETGLRAHSVRYWGDTYPFPTNVTTRVHLFFTDDILKSSTPEEGVEICKVPISKLRDLVADNEISHSASLVCVLKYLASI